MIEDGISGGRIGDGRNFEEAGISVEAGVVVGNTQNQRLGRQKYCVEDNVT